MGGPHPATMFDPAWNPHLLPQRPDLAEAFVPGTPVSATIHRYDLPVGQPRLPDSSNLRLAFAGEMTGQELHEFVSGLNDAPPYPMRCRGNPTSVIDVRFHYDHGEDVNVRMGAYLCFNATNGSRVAMVGGAIPERLRPPPPPPPTVWSGA